MAGADRIKRIFWLTTLGIVVALIIITIPWFWRLFYPYPYRENILRHAREFSIEPNLVVAVVRVESKFRTTAESPRGARGLMQLMPETARWAAGQMGIKYKPGDLFDPEYNITIGSWYLANLLHEFDGNLPAALAAYNGGRGNVREWLEKGTWQGDVENLERIPFRETRNFVARVLHDYKVYNALYKN